MNMSQLFTCQYHKTSPSLRYHDEHIPLHLHSHTINILLTFLYRETKKKREGHESSQATNKYSLGGHKSCCNQFSKTHSLTRQHLS